MGNNPIHLTKEIGDSLSPLLDKDLLFHSRIHPLLHFGADVYVKREDESGFSYGGSKKRKFASLLPYLAQHDIALAFLIGGANSNHIVGLTQLLHERGIAYHLFLKEANREYLEGNGFLLKILADPNRIQWVPKAEWAQVSKIVNQAASQTGDRYLIIPEGGNCREAVAGAATLMLDIIENEQKISFELSTGATSPAAFQHIWVDAGTGLTAATLIAMNRLLDRDSHIHVIMMAGDANYFEREYEQVTAWLAEILRKKIPDNPPYSTHFPGTARSFGSVNSQVKKAILHFARTEGILTDPIYTAKLFMTAKAAIKSGQYPGSHLIVHSGGGTGLMGFSSQMQKT